MPRGRILIVDDELAIATTLSELLRARFDAVAVGDPLAALGLLRSGRFDGVLSDVAMPELSGIELYRILRAELPALAGRFVLMTGGLPRGEDQRFVAAERIPLLEKPFDLEEAERAIAARLGVDR